MARFGVGDVIKSADGLFVWLGDEFVPLRRVNNSLQADMKRYDLLLCPPIVDAEVAGIGLLFSFADLRRTPLGAVECIGTMNDLALSYLQATKIFLLEDDRKPLRELGGIGYHAWLKY